MSGVAEQMIHADSAMDLWAYFLAGLPATIAAITAAVVAVRSRSHNRAIRSQVENDHDTNLRDDIDKVTAIVQTVDERTRRIGDEQIREQKARREADKRTNDQISEFVEDVLTRLDRQDRIADKYHPGEP
ncbi:DUF2746 domain-containing protein [Gordonia sihwensis]|uniref:DUF2746 domain-containing protein n=1 Tax=Gordonia sihwensis TaxID=173559 RepID=UPI002415F9FB|nr:DUF2746 domain-containing protein [Gordonia sihwensis]WFN93482.1 DUF2746 domain-containing protein [Gordonia sihwensis]